MLQSIFISLVAPLEECAPSLHKDLFTRTQMKARGNGYKLHHEYFYLDIRKKVFYTENNHSLKQPPQGHARVPIMGGFQDEIGQGAS